MTDTVWVVGEYAGQDLESGATAWDLVGIFRDEEKALPECITRNHFLAPVTLDSVMQNTALWPGVRYPLIEQESEEA